MSYVCICVYHILHICTNTSVWESYAEQSKKETETKRYNIRKKNTKKNHWPKFSTSFLTISVLCHYRNEIFFLSIQTTEHYYMETSVFKYAIRYKAEKSQLQYVTSFGFLALKESR